MALASPFPVCSVEKSDSRRLAILTMGGEAGRTKRNGPRVRFGGPLHLIIIWSFYESSLGPVIEYGIA